MKPMIAVTLRSTDDGGLCALASTKSYHDAITAAGGNCIFIGPDHEPEYYDTVAEFCHGLVITGGRDIHPAAYHQTPHPDTIPDFDYIDKMDFELLRAFSRKSKPILGICRGAQDINVFFGGTLYQHLPDIPKFTCNHKEKQIPDAGAHHVTWLLSIPGLYDRSQILPVNSLHHQGFCQIAPGFQTAAVSEDTLVEAICKDNILGIQWHPERLIKDELYMRTFRYFLSLC